MENKIVLLKTKLRTWTLFLGVCQILVGCIVGAIPPTAVPWFRGLVMGHIVFTANGVLMIVFAFLINDLRLETKALIVWFTSLQIGTWANGTAGLVGAMIGYSSALMPIINQKYPAPNGLDHPLVTGLLKLCAVSIIVSLLITLYGLLKGHSKTL